MDKNNEELREMISKIWPLVTKQKLDLLVTPNSSNLTR
jgi:hypothetical protein